MFSFFLSLHRAGFCSTAPDVYAVVRCENDNVRTRVFKESRNPEFNLRTIFYRRYPNTDISVEVWHIPVPSHAAHKHTGLMGFLCIDRYTAEVCCGTRFSVRLDSRRPSLRGVEASWWICEADGLAQGSEVASILRRLPACASQTCDSLAALANTALSGRSWWANKGAVVFWGFWPVVF